MANIKYMSYNKMVVGRICSCPVSLDQNKLESILSWKKSQINNGICLGLNSVLQAEKRKARGYKIQHFKIIAYLLTDKLDFSKINANCLPTVFQKSLNYNQFEQKPWRLIIHGNRTPDDLSFLPGGNHIRE